MIVFTRRKIDNKWAYKAYNIPMKQGSTCSYLMDSLSNEQKLILKHSTPNHIYHTKRNASIKRT